MTHHVSRNLLLAAALLSVTAPHSLFAQPSKPTPAPAKAPERSPKLESAAPGATKPPTEAKPGAAIEYKTADELLGALETADKKITSISAELNFTTVAGDIEGNDKQIRRGWLYFRNRTDAKTEDGKPAPGSNAAACVRFDSLIQSSSKLFEEKKTYVVDGPVLVERIEKEKLVNRYRIGKPDQPQDPLKLGQGPFPLPFGQQKEEVLGRFKAELVSPLETMDQVPSLQARLSATYQLKLTPKSEAGVSSKVKEVRVWYQKSDLLPILARIMRPDGGFDEFFLVGIQVNKALPAGVFDTSIPEGWKVEEKERP